MYTAAISTNVAIGGDSYSGQVTGSGDGTLNASVSLPAGNVGTLTTRTVGSGGDHDAIATCTGHTIITGDIVDVYWVGGVQYGCTATVSGSAITLATGNGTHFPAQTTVVWVSKAVPINADFEPDDLDLIVVMSDQDGHAHFAQEGDTPLHAGTSIAALPLIANEVWHYKAGGLMANPLTGARVGVIMASVSRVTAATIHVNVIYDATPAA